MSISHGGAPAGHHAEVVKHGRFANLPLRKDDVRRDAPIRWQAAAQAFAEYAKRYGRKPDPAMREWAYAGQIAPWHPMEGSRLRESTQRDILRRLRLGVPLSARQRFFFEEACEWQLRASQLAIRTLVLNSAELLPYEQISLEWVPNRG